ncbi:MAG TPA: IS200/IS605 family transposase [Lachnospiraceae bacterium]|nr:IS200/IS605 family transposase [Lachnospiraceae bacterium]
MRQSYFELYIHVIWVTKNRELLINEKTEKSIYTIIKDKCKKFKVDLIAVGNISDHIHLLISINPSIKIAEFMAEIKGMTSHFVNHDLKGTLYWQDGYGVLSISKSGLDFVKKYIENQKEYHNNKKRLVEILERTEI